MHYPYPWQIAERRKRYTPSTRLCNAGRDTRLEPPIRLERLEPKLSLAVLERIEAFLKKRTSPFVRLRALNPKYEPVRVRANIRFQQGLNTVFYISQLKKDLLKFLAPWSGGDNSRINFWRHYVQVGHFGIHRKEAICGLPHRPLDVGY